MTNVGIVKSVKGNMAKVFVGAGSETTRWIETEAFNPVNAKVGGEGKGEHEVPCIPEKGIGTLCAAHCCAPDGCGPRQSVSPAYFRGTSPDVLSAPGGFFLFLSSLLTANFFPGK